MKNIPAPLQQHLDGELTSLAMLMLVECKNGTQHAFTTHDQTLVHNNINYLATPGLNLSALDAQSGLAPDNNELIGALSSNLISSDDIRAGHYDGARITISICNWQAMWMGTVILRTSIVNSITENGGGFSFELKGLTSYFENQIGSRQSRLCRWRFGGAECGVNAANAQWHKSGNLTHISDDQTQFTDAQRTEENHFFSFGLIEFTSGNNNGLRFPIMNFSAQTFQLWSPPPFPLQIGDEYVATAGCDKIFSSCKARFANQHNFGGFPHIPGADILLRTPDAKLD